VGAGYERLLAVLADPTHAEHADYAEWFPDGIDSEPLDHAAATRQMRRGLPDWRQHR
jgi:hypothetical protein